MLEPGSQLTTNSEGGRSWRLFIVWQVMFRVGLSASLLMGTVLSVFGSRRASMARLRVVRAEGCGLVRGVCAGTFAKIF